jgi:hypothetical protein
MMKKETLGDGLIPPHHPTIIVFTFDKNKRVHDEVLKCFDQKEISVKEVVLCQWLSVFEHCSIAACQDVNNQMEGISFRPILLNLLIGFLAT